MKNEWSTIFVLKGIFDISLKMGEKYVFMNILPKKMEVFPIFTIEECKILTDKKFLLEVQ